MNQCKSSRVMQKREANRPDWEAEIRQLLKGYASTDIFVILRVKFFVNGNTTPYSKS
jgi:hypothetical protein